MYGADYPFTNAEIVLKNLKALEDYLENAPDLRQYKDLILYENAKKLFHR